MTLQKINNQKTFWWTLNLRYALYLARECTGPVLLLYALLASIDLLFPWQAFDLFRWVFLPVALLHTATWFWTGYIVMRGRA